MGKVARPEPCVNAGVLISGPRAASREAIRARAAEVGFVINSKPGGRIYNTFDAHRLLHWAAIEGRQYALKRALRKIAAIAA